MSKQEKINKIREILQPKTPGVTTVYYMENGREVDSGYQIANLDGVNRKMIMHSKAGVENLKKFIEAE